MAAAIAGNVVLILLIVLFAWLVWRAWRLRRPALRWTLTAVAVLLTLVLLLFGAVVVAGYVKLNWPVSRPVTAVQFSATPELADRGAHLAHLCAGCHSTSGNPPLDGGKDSLSPALLGAIYAPNLTPAGPLLDWSDGEIVRAIQEGIGKGDRPLMIMPAEDFHYLSDNDVLSILAYLRAQPAVQHTTPATGFTPLGAAIIGSGMFSPNVQPPIPQPIADPPPGRNAEHGKYLVEISGCRTCHGANLMGGTSGFVPKGPNLPVLVSRWDDAGFVKTIRTGTDPSGHVLDPDMMPWKEFSAAYSDDELRAIFAYLQSLPAR